MTQNILKGNQAGYVLLESLIALALLSYTFTAILNSANHFTRGHQRNADTILIHQCSQSLADFARFQRRDLATPKSKAAPTTPITEDEWRVISGSPTWRAELLQTCHRTFVAYTTQD